MNYSNYENVKPPTVTVKKQLPLDILLDINVELKIDLANAVNKGYFDAVNRINQNLALNTYIMQGITKNA